MGSASDANAGLVNLRGSQRETILTEIVDWASHSLSMDERSRSPAKRYAGGRRPRSDVDSPFGAETMMTTASGVPAAMVPSGEFRGSVRLSVPVYTLMYLCNAIVTQKLEGFRSSVHRYFPHRPRRGLQLSQESSMYDLDLVDSSVLDGRGSLLSFLFSRRTNPALRLFCLIVGADSAALNVVLNSAERMCGRLFNPVHSALALITFLLRLACHLSFDIIVVSIQLLATLVLCLRSGNESSVRDSAAAARAAADESNRGSDSGGSAVSNTTNEHGTNPTTAAAAAESRGVSMNINQGLEMDCAKNARAYLASMMSCLLFYDQRLAGQLSSGLNTLDFLVLSLDELLGTDLMASVYRAKGLSVRRPLICSGDSLFELRRMRADEFARSVKYGLRAPSRSLHHLLSGVLNLHALRFSNALSVPGLASMVKQTETGQANDNNDRSSGVNSGGLTACTAGMNRKQLRAFEARLKKMLRSDPEYLLSGVVDDLFQLCLPVPRVYLCNRHGLSLQHARLQRRRRRRKEMQQQRRRASAGGDSGSSPYRRSSTTTTDGHTPHASSFLDDSRHFAEEDLKGLIAFAPKDFGSRVNVPSLADAAGEYYSLKLTEIVKEMWLTRLQLETGSSSYHAGQYQRYYQRFLQMRVPMPLKCQVLPMLESFTRRLALRQYAYYLAYLNECEFSQCRIRDHHQSRRAQHPSAAGVGASADSSSAVRESPHLFGYGRLPTKSCLSDELYSFLPTLFGVLNEGFQRWPLDFVHGHFEVLIEILLNVLCPWRVAFMEAHKYDAAFVPRPRRKRRSWLVDRAMNSVTGLLATGLGLSPNDDDDRHQGSAQENDRGSGSGGSSSSAVGYGGMKYTRVRPTFLTVNSYDFAREREHVRRLQQQRGAVDASMTTAGDQQSNDSGRMSSRNVRKKLRIGTKRRTLCELLSQSILAFDSDYHIHAARRMINGEDSADAGATGTGTAAPRLNEAREWTQYIVEVLPFYSNLLNPCLNLMQYCDYRTEASRTALFQLAVLFGDSRIRWIVQRAEQLFFSRTLGVREQQQQQGHIPAGQRRPLWTLRTRWSNVKCPLWHTL